MIIELEDIQNGLVSTQWDFGNEVLYNLCKENFQHREEDKIIAKVWLIGRSYAAAIERRRNKAGINDDFYTEVVAPAFKNSKLDSYLNDLKQCEEITNENIERILLTHNYLMQVIKEITDLEKRSLCSKYLHFHLPNLFYIYDSRVLEVIRQYVSRPPRDMKHIYNSPDVDTEYAKFFLKSFELRNSIENMFGLKLSPREVDKVLIVKANNSTSIERII